MTRHTFDQAVFRLRKMTAAESEPVLTDSDLSAVLYDAQRIDRYGVKPSEEGWEPTYDLNAAAADAWQMKAAAAAGDYDFSADGASYSRSQIVAQCLAMEDRYRKRAGHRYGRRTTTTDVIAN